jgi:hypothetical protein
LDHLLWLKVVDLVLTLALSVAMAVPAVAAELRVLHKLVELRLQGKETTAEQMEIQARPFQLAAVAELVQLVEQALEAQQVQVAQD